MTFHELLARADDQALQDIIGPPAVKILRLLDSSLATPSKLRELIMELRTATELLRDPGTRTALTSLLPPDQAAQLATALLGRSVEDPFAVLADISVRKGSSTEHSLLDFFSVIPEAESSQPPLPDSEAVRPGYGLFDHQRRAAAAIAAKLRNGPRRALLHMPTGAGKTRTAMNVIAEHLRDRGRGVVIWLAYSEELCEQAVQEFQEAWRFLGDRALPVHRYWGRHELGLSDLHEGLVVGGLSKVYQAAKGSIPWLARLADKTSLVVIDEAHQAIADTYRLVLNGISVKNTDTALLGLTATPGRTWNDPAQDEELAKFFAREKVTLAAPDGSNPVDFLIEQGFLARPLFSSLHHGGGLELTARDEASLASQLDIPLSILRRLAEDERRNLAIVQKIEELAGCHQRILLFAATVEHAELLAVVLRARGIAADAITGDTASSERARIIGRFRSARDEPLVISNFGVLTTGFDAPRTSAALIARPTTSLVLYSQMLGRAIRGPRAGGNTEAEVVTVVDPSLPGFGNIGDAFLNWEDVW